MAEVTEWPSNLARPQAGVVGKAADPVVLCQAIYLTPQHGAKPPTRLACYCRRFPKHFVVCLRRSGRYRLALNAACIGKKPSLSAPDMRFGSTAVTPTFRKFRRSITVIFV